MNSTNELVFALINWKLSVAEQDARVLLREHDARTKGASGRPALELEVFKRAALILTVTWWESFIEDVIEGVFRERLNAAVKPGDLGRTFTSVAESWLDSRKGQRPKAVELVAWTGEGWKEIIRSRFLDELKNLHTPDSRGVRHLSKRYLGADLTLSWRWPGTDSEGACRRLDRMIRRRGEIVHRGRDIYKSSKSVRKVEVVEALALVKRLMTCTSRALAQSAEREARTI